MAWDKDRPYAPFTPAHEDWRNKLVGERMDSYAYASPDNKDIDAIYETGELVIHGEHFRKFKEVELTLTFVEYTRGRSSTVFWWIDEDGCTYPMFCMEVERLLFEDKLRKTISGIWSAEKRGGNYGVTLVGVAE